MEKDEDWNYANKIFMFNSSLFAIAVLFVPFSKPEEYVSTQGRAGRPFLFGHDA